MGAVAGLASTTNQSDFTDSTEGKSANGFPYMAAGDKLIHDNTGTR